VADPLTYEQAQTYLAERVEQFFEEHPPGTRQSEEFWEMDFTNWLMERREEINDP
jgi:hypothetical protein